MLTTSHHVTKQRCTHLVQLVSNFTTCTSPYRPCRFIHQHEQNTLFLYTSTCGQGARACVRSRDRMRSSIAYRSFEAKGKVTIVSQDYQNIRKFLFESFKKVIILD